MTIELSARVEKDLRDLAVTQNRTVGEVVEDAIRLYLGAASITDLEAEEVGETQSAMVGELRGMGDPC